MWKKYKNKRITKHEFLSGMSKDEKFVPIITLVLYLGTGEKWDGAVCLYDLLDMDDKLKPFITNYKLNLFDYHTCEDFSVFQTENRVLFEVLANADNIDKFWTVMKQNNELYNNLDYESANAITRITGMDIDLEK